jgi:hypothetical protein
MENQVRSNIAPVQVQSHAELVQATFAAQAAASAEFSSTPIGELDIEGDVRIRHWVGKESGKSHAALMLQGVHNVYFYDSGAEAPIDFSGVTVWATGSSDKSVEDPQVIILLPKGEGAKPYAILG